MHIRWMIRRDMGEVCAIERASFPHPWGETDFRRALHQRNVIGMVCDLGEAVGGYMVYELLQTRIELLNLAVAPGERMQGFGRAMLDRLLAKLAPTRRRSIGVNVWERNVGAQCFFRACGWRCVGAETGYAETDDLALRFVRRVTDAARERA